MRGVAILCLIFATCKDKESVNPGVCIYYEEWLRVNPIKTGVFAGAGLYLQNSKDEVILSP